MTKYAFCFALTYLALGCGGQPVTMPKKKVVTFSSVCSKTAGLKLPVAEKRYTVVGQKSLPSEDELETLFAKKATLAEVGPSPKGIEVALPGVLCSVEPGSRPKSLPKSAVLEEVELHGLSQAEATALNGGTHFYQVSCKLNVDAPLRALPEQAEQVASVTAELSEGWIFDEHSGRYWPKDAWRDSRAKNKRYAINRLVRIVQKQDAAGKFLLATRGLGAFGRPDYALYPVPADDITTLSKALTTLSDIIIATQDSREWFGIDFGHVKAIGCEYGTLMKTTGLKGPSLTADDGLSPETLLLGDPTLDIEGSGSYQQFLRKLKIR